jgi:NADH-quinone oxidoreductase subunit H
MSLLDVVMVLIRVLFGVIVPLTFVVIFVWMERRGASFIQDRAGPNRCNIGGFTLGGLIQPVADAVKLVFKEDILPAHVEHKFYFVIAPAIVFLTSLVAFAVIPFADVLVIGESRYVMQAIPMDIGILWFLGIAGFAVYGFILAGWASHNKYGILGGLRASAQLISYEIPMGLALVSVLMVYGTVHLTEIAQFQGELLFGFLPAWGIILQPLGAIIFITTAFAEANRVPFDLAEGESEIVAGYHTEYSSMKFAMFFMGEYVAMFVSSALIVTLFFGGYQIPWLDTQKMVTYSKQIIIALIILLPILSVFFTAWMKKNNKSHYDRPNDPRVRETRILTKVIYGLVGLVVIGLVLYLLFLTGSVYDRVLVVVLQVIVFLVKTFLMGFVYIWVRWTLPRFRYDQLQILGWRILLPLALLNIVVTGAVITF